jgi:uncharacterized iron-regulated membrane protein
MSDKPLKHQLRPLIRKTHRFLGITIGLQFLLWTLSGLYFSWTNINEIHGDPFLAHKTVSVDAESVTFDPEKFGQTPISQLELKILGDESYWWVNESILVDAESHAVVDQIPQALAARILKQHLKDTTLKVVQTKLLEEVGAHHEYRGRPLPVWAFTLDHPEALTAYISASDGEFQRVRHRKWRIFDALWMFHTMDYAGRDNFNNLLLRAFSLFGLFTICSGFALFWATKR